MITLAKKIFSNRGILNSTLYARGNRLQEVQKRFSSKEEPPEKNLSEEFYHLCQKHPRIVLTVFGFCTLWALNVYHQKYPRYYPELAKDLLEEQTFIHPFVLEGNNSFIKRHFYNWPWIVLFWDRMTKNKNIWDIKTNEPFDYHKVKEEDYEKYSFALKFQEAITVAREGADLRLLINPQYLQQSTVDNVVKSLHDMATVLIKHHINKCLVEHAEVSFRHIANSIESVNAQSLVDSSGFDAVAGDTIPQRRVAKEAVAAICLSAILAHSIDPSQIPVLLELNVLSYLSAIFNAFESDQEVVSLILKILANISVDKNTRVEIHKSGCLYILTKFARDSNINFSFPARRALMNLDRKPEGDVLLSGIYQMYPVNRFDEKNIDFDIVFIHGLLGSAFKTWRRQELSSVKEDRRALLTTLLQERLTELIKGKAPVFTDSYDIHMNKHSLLKNSNVPKGYHSQMVHMTEEEIMEYCKDWPKEGVPLEATDYYPHDVNGVVSNDTLCWPQDWLPLDCPNGRIINVDFESFISKLWPICPIEQYEEGLVKRSEEMMEKLIAAGVGKRPIIFVCHSMGGLLAKHIIVNADASTDPKAKAIATNTKSVFFYSTPHYGSDYGRVLIDKGGRLLIPTKEFEEISGASDSLDDLVNLQEKFFHVYEKYKYHLVSLSESKPSQGGFGLEIYLVPRHSSDMGHGENFSVMLDHLNICKPFCRRSFVYAKLVAHLQSKFPSGSPCEKIKPFFVLQKDSDCQQICSTLGLGEYVIIDPHLIVGPIRGPKEVAEWEKINRESEEDNYAPDHDHL